jgi:predicted RNase H-like nuclease
MSWMSYPLVDPDGVKLSRTSALAVRLVDQNKVLNLLEAAWEDSMGPDGVVKVQIPIQSALITSGNQPSHTGSATLLGVRLSNLIRVRAKSGVVEAEICIALT